MSKTSRFLDRRAEKVKQNQRRRQRPIDAITPEMMDRLCAAFIKATETVVLRAMNHLAGAVKALQAANLHRGGQAPAFVPAILPTPEAIIPKPAVAFPEEGGPCPTGCGGTLELPPVENCSCHIHPPCSACTSNRLTCPVCGWEEPEPETEHEPLSPAAVAFYDKLQKDWEEAFKRGHTFPHGGRVFEVTHDGRSGSTHVIKGKYEGPVTHQDIIDHFGSGTFGHRGPTLSPAREWLNGPVLNHGTFTYTKITD